MIKSIVFDLDDTICFPNHDAKDTLTKYGKAEPNWPVIEKMRELKSMGYMITILSARRMVTHNGDIDAIIKDVAEVTIAWLDEYKVPCDDLQFGKPYSSTYYVDDKAMNIEEFLSKDFTSMNK
mgnify:CR=1 FL=1